MKTLEKILPQKSVKPVSRYATEEDAVQDKLKKMNELLSKTDLSLFYKNIKRA
jgi:hypothetical protein